MNQKSRGIVTLIVPVAMFAGAALAWAGELSIAANTPEVRISTRPGGRNFMRLPSLQYEFIAAADCPAGFVPGTLSLSIADTRVTNSLDADSTSRVEFSVSVPAAQIGPVAVNAFCTTDKSDSATDSQRTLRISSVLSAQAALLCVSDTESEITYTSAALDVLLRCDSVDESAAKLLRRDNLISQQLPTGVSQETL